MKHPGRAGGRKNPLKGLMASRPKTYQDYLKTRKEKGLSGSAMSEEMFKFRSTHKRKFSGGREQGPRFLGIPIYAEEYLQRRKKKPSRKGK